MAFGAGVYLCILSIVFSLIGRDFGFSIWGDEKWYLEAGRSLLSGDFKFEYLAFAPLHSILTAIRESIADAFDIGILSGVLLLNSIYSILLGAVIYQFTRFLIDFSFLNSREGSILCICILSSPYVIRYSTGLNPEYYSLMGGIFILGKVLIDSSLLSSDSVLKVRAVGEKDYFRFLNIFGNVMNLSRKWFLILIVFICLCRYSFIVFAIPYFWGAKYFGFRHSLSMFLSIIMNTFNEVLSACSSVLLGERASVVVGRSRISGENNSKRTLDLIVYFLTSFALAIVFGLVFRGNFLLDFSLCRSIQSVFLFMGFREAFYGTSCLSSFDPAIFAEGFARGGLGYLPLNFYGSLVFGALNFMVSCFGFLGIFSLKRKNVADFFLASFLSNLLIVFTVGTGHYRYMLPFLPSLYFGALLFFKKFRIAGVKS